MEKKKPGTVTVPKENVKELLGKAKDGIVKAMDQNGDGTFDMKDVSVIAGSIGNAAKDTISAMKESTEERGRIAERKALCPIFADDLDSADFALTKLIRITDIDKKRAESEVCRDSIGYVSAQEYIETALYLIFTPNTGLFFVYCSIYCGFVGVYEPVHCVLSLICRLNLQVDTER